MLYIKFILFYNFKFYFPYILVDFWKFQRTLCKSYYPIYKLWLGPIAFVSVHHPNDLEVKEILKDKLISDQFFIVNITLLK